MPMTANGLAKLLEELGELSQVAAKRLAYFHTSTHPDGAGDLNERMEDEIADVRAACAFVAEQFGLSNDRITSRTLRKKLLFQQWHADPSNGADCFHAPRPPGVGGRIEDLHREALALIRRLEGPATSMHDGLPSAVRLREVVAELVSAASTDAGVPAADPVQSFQREHLGEPYTCALNGIPATWQHDEGAYAQCGDCGRYTLNPRGLREATHRCECGSTTGWSGSFTKPGPDAKWSGKAPDGVPSSSSDQQEAGRG